MELFVIGLVLIIIGWLVQVSASWKGSPKIKREFVLVYAVGVLVLVVDSYLAGSMLLAGLDFVSASTALLLFSRLK